VASAEDLVVAKEAGEMVVMRVGEMVAVRAQNY